MQIQKRSDAYKITVSCGFDENGKQIRRTTTFVPPKGLTSKQEQKAVLEFAEDFERKVKGGANVQYNKMTFRVLDCSKLAVFLKLGDNLGTVAIIPVFNQHIKR